MRPLSSLRRSTAVQLLFVGSGTKCLCCIYVPENIYIIYIYIYIYIYINPLLSLHYIPPAFLFKA